MAPETFHLDGALRDLDEDSELMDELAQTCLPGFYGADLHPSFRSENRTAVRGHMAPKACSSVMTTTSTKQKHIKQHCTDFMMFLSQWHLPTQGNAYVDVAELCGGNARTSLVLVHRYHHLNVGKNFDITVGIDLSSMIEVAALWKYLAQNRVHVVIMSVPCTGMAGWQRLNKITNPESWTQSRKLSEPLGRLAGQISEYQLRRRRHFLSEHPQTTEMYHLDEWAYARNHPSLAWCVVHQCMTGFVDYKKPYFPIEKATMIWASDERLVAPLRQFWCDGSHKHEQAKGETAHRARLWTWQFASAIAAGIHDVIQNRTVIRGHMAPRADSRQTYVGLKQHDITLATTPPPYFPDVGTGDSADAVVETAPTVGGETTETGHGPTPGAMTCAACKAHRAQDDTRHTRDPVGCMYPGVVPREYVCPSCRRRLSRLHEEHTYDAECRFGTRPRETTTSSRTRHARDPRVRAAHEPTAELRPETDPGLESPLPALAPEVSTSSSSARPSVGQALRAPPLNVAIPEAARSGEASSEDRTAGRGHMVPQASSSARVPAASHRVFRPGEVQAGAPVDDLPSLVDARTWSP